MVLTLRLTSDTERYILRKSQEAGISAEEYAANILAEHTLRSEKQERLVAVLDSWIEEGNAEEQTSTGAYLIQALDEDRTSYRKLFPPELKGVTW